MGILIFILESKASVRYFTLIKIYHIGFWMCPHTVNIYIASNKYKWEEQLPDIPRGWTRELQVSEEGEKSRAGDTRLTGNTFKSAS